MLVLIDTIRKFIDEHEIPTHDINYEHGLGNYGGDVSIFTKMKRSTPHTHTQDLTGKLRQRIAEIGRPKQFNFKETLNKHWKLAAKDPRFKAFTHSSSFVGNVKYDQDEQSMQIILNGKTYDFCNVEERLFDSFSGAGSKGAFFNREIKSLHNCGAW